MRIIPGTITVVFRCLEFVFNQRLAPKENGRFIQELSSPQIAGQIRAGRIIQKRSHHEQNIKQTDNAYMRSHLIIQKLPCFST